MASTPLPRGILKVQYKTKNGTVTKYRVRIDREDFKADKRFDSLQEAKQFLLLSKTAKGKELVYSITEEERQEKKEFYLSVNNDFSVGYFIDKYIEQYISTKPKETELERRSVNNTLSFFKTIKHTLIVDRHISLYEMKESSVFNATEEALNIQIQFADIRKIRAIDINSFAKTRLKEGVKPVTVQREITQLSNVFRKLQYLDERLADLDNPCLKHDKDLVKSNSIKREVNLTKEEIDNIFKLMQQRKNLYVYQVCMLSILTSLRRSEIVYLKYSQIKDNYIELFKTKTQPMRKVFIDKIAIDFIKTIKNDFGNDRLFNFTIAGFEGSFNKFVEKNNLNVNFHDFRKIAITKKIIQIGAENSVFITEFLGISNLKKFEDTHIKSLETNINNQASALKSFGHNYGQTTKVYFTMPKTKKLVD